VGNSLSKVLCRMMMELHGAKEARCMFLRAAEITVCVTFPGHVVFISSFDTGYCLAAGSPQVTTTSSDAFVASFMTDEDTSLDEWYYIDVYLSRFSTNSSCIISGLQTVLVSK
jgi:hypothetical protein